MAAVNGGDTCPTLLSRLERQLQLAPRCTLQGSRRAAVCAVCRDGDDGDCEVLFIHRAEDPRDPWSGHMAFPVGRVDANDRSPLNAAIREAREELGIDLEERARLIGHLSDVTAVARGRRLGLIIEPFVFKLLHPVRICPNEEVQDVLWIPLDFFLESANRSTLQYRYDTATIALPCYRYRSKVVWGLTLRMIDELLSLVTGFRPNDWPTFDHR